MVTSNEELMEKLEELLDIESRVVKNWHHLGLKLGLNKNTLQLIKSGESRKDLQELFEYIYNKIPDLTVLRFKEIMEEMERGDICKELSKYEEGS